MTFEERVRALEYEPGGADSFGTMTFQELMEALNEMAEDANDRPGHHHAALDFVRAYMEAHEEEVAEELGDRE